MARCPRCRAAAELADEVGAALRRLPVPGLAPGEAEALWQGVRRGVMAPAPRDPLAALRAARAVAVRRPGMAWVAGGAVAVIALALLARFPETRNTLQAGLNALTVIQRVEAGSNTSVFVLETPRERLRVIWILEPPAAPAAPPPGKEGSELWPSIPAGPLLAAPSLPSSAC